MPGRPTNVYYLPAGAKEPILIDDQNPRPNGLTLTLDGRTLLVDNTVGPVVFAFDVQNDGTVKNRRPFLQLQDIPEDKESGADGMAIDRGVPPPIIDSCDSRPHIGDRQGWRLVSKQVLPCRSQSSMALTAP
jgi:hypothetical protein